MRKSYAKYFALAVLFSLFGIAIQMLKSGGGKPVKAKKIDIVESIKSSLARCSTSFNHNILADSSHSFSHSDSLGNIVILYHHGRDGDKLGKKIEASIIDSLDAQGITTTFRDTVIDSWTSRYLVVDYSTHVAAHIIMRDDSNMIFKSSSFQWSNTKYLDEIWKSP
jgi:hypothetical protein